MTTVLKNGHVYTMDQERPYVTAVAVQDNRIIYVGNDEGAKAYENGARVIDLAGKMLIPGMIDAHCHPIVSAFFTSGFLCDAEMKKEDVLETVRAYVAEHPEKECYFGLGYPEWVFGEAGPQKADLDAICPDKPVFILSNGIHEAWCNTKTLEVLNITKDTPDPLPGHSYFRRDQDGNPTGIVIEAAAEGMIMGQLPWFDESTVKEIYRQTFDMYSALGVTGFVDCGVSSGFEKGMDYISEFERTGQLKQRFCGCIMVSSPDQVETAVSGLKDLHAAHHSDLYNINTLKIVNDGTIESSSAAMAEPYVDGSNANPMVYGEALRKVCLEAAAEGFDIHIHGIGDRTIHENLMAAKAVREAGYFDTRFINAHTHLVQPADLPLFAKYNVLANTSSIWHYDAPEAETVLGPWRYRHQFELQSILQHGARMTLGSDYPADEMGNEPLKGIQMGVTRQLYLQDNPPMLEPKSEALTVEQCLAAYTINAAYGMHMDDKFGSLTVGKYADLVVLERDLNEIDPHEIMNVPVLLTMMNGEPTYISETFAEHF